MEPLPSDPRQPPDGHEFPDFQDGLHRTTNNNSVMAQFKLNLSQTNQVDRSQIIQDNDVLTNNGNQTNNYRSSSFNNHSTQSFGLNKLTSMSNKDLSDSSKDVDHDYYGTERNKIRNDPLPLIYSRSQSLYDIPDKKQNDHWQNIMEQRRKSLSKLKGLVIPDVISETDFSTTINLPEIKSCTSVSIDHLNSLDSSEASNETSQPNSVDSSSFPLISPLWSENIHFPKYSPAFKRKNLKLYTTPKLENEKSDFKVVDLLDRRNSSESSFECATTKSKSDQKPSPIKSYSIETSLLGAYPKIKTVEDESDNDSAVSSSQSSFMSRPTTSPSPTRSIDLDTGVSKLVLPECRLPEDHRHLKPASVEAINRKNILASSRCRSGKDLKVGSPIINRKLDEPDEKGCGDAESVNVKVKEASSKISKEDQPNHEIKNEIEKIEAVPVKVASIVQQPIRKSSTGTIADMTPPPTTSPLKMKFDILSVGQQPQRQSFTRSVSKDSASIFKYALKPIPPVVTKKEQKVSRFTNAKSLSVTDLRKNFEDIAKATPALNIEKDKLTTLKNGKSEPTPPQANYRKSSFIKETKEQASSTQNEITLCKKEPPTNTRRVILKPDNGGGSIGVTLSGESDKDGEITIHRIRYGSVAYQEGSLTKGDKIISINGVNTNGMTNLEAAELLNVPAKSVVIEIAAREKSRTEYNARKKSFPLENLSQQISNASISEPCSSKKPTHEISLQKDGNGLGFSVEGGRDSPQGDVPLIVKKIFQGGVAEKDGRLKVGDEILAINDISFTSFSRIQAWTMMKKLEVGTAKISIFR